MTKTSKQNRQGIDALLTTENKRSRRKKMISVIVALIILGGGGIAAYEFLLGGAGEEQRSYDTVNVERGDLKSSITSTGTVEALNTVEVGAEISGQVKTITVDFNDPVTKGQLLVELDPQTQEANVSEAKARVLAANAGRAEAKATLLEATQSEARIRALVEKGLSSSKELESAVASLAKAKASLVSAKANTALAEAAYESAVTNLSKTKILSPIDGTVLSREVEVGQALNAGMSTPVLFTLAQDLRSMELSSQVDEADIGMVKKGLAASFTVDAFPDKPFPSQVTSVRNVATTDSNVVSYEVLLTVDNSELLLKPGMTATVDIVTESVENVLIVPNKAFRFTPLEAVSDSGGRRRGPPMPLLGGGGRGKQKKSSKNGGGNGGPGWFGGPGGPGNGQAPGEKSADMVTLWVLRSGAAVPMKVKRIATDGSRSAIEGEGVTQGLPVIVDLIESGEE